MTKALTRSRGKEPETLPHGKVRSVARGLWWFVLPALAIYLYVVVVPTFQGIYASFTNWTAFSRDRSFVGLQNYAQLFRGDVAPAALRTLLIAAAAMIIQNVAGLLLALALNQRVRGRNFVRAVIFAPAVISALVVGYLFKYIFGPPGTGAANYILNSLGLSQIDFLGQPTSALWIIILVCSWQFTGVSMVIYLAGLQGIPQELLEAASLDGASASQRFRHVIAPLLAPAFTINLMLGLIGGLKIFDQIFALTNGGPAGKTQTIATLIYQQFSQLGFWGRSTALAVLLAIAVAILSIVQFWTLRRQEAKV